MLISLCNCYWLTVITVITLFFLIAIASNKNGPIIGSVVGCFVVVIIVGSIMCCIGKSCKSRKHRTSFIQQVELRSAGTTIVSYPLARNPPPSYPKEPPTSFLQQSPASNLEQPPLPAGNTACPDQDTNMEEVTLRLPPPPTYAELYNN